MQIITTNFFHTNFIKLTFMMCLLGVIKFFTGCFVTTLCREMEPAAATANAVIKTGAVAKSAAVKSVNTIALAANNKLIPSGTTFRHKGNTYFAVEDGLYVRYDNNQRLTGNKQATVEPPVSNKTFVQPW